MGERPIRLHFSVWRGPAKLGKLKLNTCGKEIQRTFNESRPPRYKPQASATFPLPMSFIPWPPRTTFPPSVPSSYTWPTRQPLPTSSTPFPLLLLWASTLASPPFRTRTLYAPLHTLLPRTCGIPAFPCPLSVSSSQYSLSQSLASWMPCTPFGSSPEGRLCRCLVIEMFGKKSKMAEQKKM